ncbi:MAG: metallophosphatase family protein [Fibromonadaceae bacterium]|jgi:putative phosphoesterase|nr:metallophosphatase family protein [Fibromonadaceae bacterium]
MKYALFSDVHGNFAAFEAMMSKLAHESIEGYLYCGDLTSYHYQTTKIAEVIKGLPNFYAVLGNNDQFFLDTLNVQAEQHITKEDIELAEFIKTLPEIITMEIGNFNFSMLHGSPSSPLFGRIYLDSPLDIGPLPYDFLFVGHTHCQMTRLHANCRIVNPGSLGQPRDGKGFSYCIVDFITGDIEYYTTSFKHHAF